VASHLLAVRVVTAQALPPHAAPFGPGRDPAPKLSEYLSRNESAEKRLKKPAEVGLHLIPDDRPRDNNQDHDCDRGR